MQAILSNHQDLLINLTPITTLHMDMLVHATFNAYSFIGMLVYEVPSKAKEVQAGFRLE